MSGSWYPLAADVVCCSGCRPPVHWHRRGVSRDLIIEGAMLDATSLGRLLRRHGHTDTADYVNPGGRTTTPPAPTQGRLL